MDDMVGNRDAAAAESMVDGSGESPEPGIRGDKLDVEPSRSLELRRLIPFMDRVSGIGSGRRLCLVVVVDSEIGWAAAVK